MIKDYDNNFLNIFNNNLVGMILTNKDHIIVNINDHLLLLAELERNNVIGKTGLELGLLSEGFIKSIWEEFTIHEKLLNRELSFKTKNNKTVNCLFSTEKIVVNDRDYWLTTIIDITKLKKTEKELSDIYERVTDAFVSIDSNWYYTYVNNKAGELLEKDPAYLVGKHIWTEFPEDIGQPVYLAYHEAMEKQRSIAMEEYYQPYDRWFQNLIYPSADGLSVFFSDITARKKAENGIAESELRFRTLTKTAPVGIFETDAAGKTTYVNETWLEFTGLSFDEALEDRWLQAVHPEDREKIIKGWYVKTGEGAESLSEYRLIDRKGKMRWVNGKAIPVINSDAEITGYIGTITDVTETRQALEMLKKSEEILNKAQRISKTGSWEFNLLTGELLWSAEQYRIFELEGHTQENLFEAMRRRYHHEDLPKLDEKIKLAIETKEGYVLEHRVICNDGSIKYILGIAEVILNNDGQVIGMKGTGQDITEQKLAEQKLTERTEQLKELSTHLQNVREEERMNIAREIHDELGQQLTGLKMDIAWLIKKTIQDDPAVKAKYDDVLSLIDATVKSIRRIATELRPSIIDDLGLNAALEWLVSEFSERLNIEIRYENSFDDKHIAPDISINLFRILQESLTNIAKHANANNAAIIFEKLDNAVHLSVRDDGIGFDMAAKTNDMTFGLLGIKERTAMMKGDFVVLSKPGGGTKIEVTIPVK